MKRKLGRYAARLAPAKEARRVDFMVHGRPAPMGSKKPVGTRYSKTSRRRVTVLAEVSPYVCAWRRAVERAAAIARREQGMVTGPVCLLVWFCVRRPPRSRRVFPTVAPDLSKLVRATEDALTDAGIWEDDSRVVTMEAYKRYVDDPDSPLTVPGAWISLTSA